MHAQVWSTKQAAPAVAVDMRANVCCVKYNPGSAHEIAVGSADHSVHLYDLRNVASPVHVFAGAGRLPTLLHFHFPGAVQFSVMRYALCSRIITGPPEHPRTCTCKRHSVQCFLQMTAEELDCCASASCAGGGSRSWSVSPLRMCPGCVYPIPAPLNRCVPLVQGTGRRSRMCVI